MKVLAPAMPAAWNCLDEWSEELPARQEAGAIQIVSEGLLAVAAATTR